VLKTNVFNVVGRALARRCLKREVKNKKFTREKYGFVELIEELRKVE